MLRRIGRGLEHVVGAEVREGEWTLVFLFFINLFLLLTAYYILKVIREPLILMGGGAVSRSYARGLQAGVLVLVVPAYSLIANRLEPSKLVKWVLAFFVVTLGAFFIAGRVGAPLGFPFFVWLGIFSTLSIAQFWSLANDLLTEEEGHRLFPLVAAGGTVGGILGAQIAAHALRWFDPYQLMLVAAAILGMCIFLTHVTHGRGLSRQNAPQPEAAPRDNRGGFSLILRDRYLLLIAGGVILLNLINTTGDYILADLVNTKAHAIADAVERKRFIGEFYGNFQTWVSVLTAGVQILLVGRLFRTLGLARSLFLLPLLAFAGYGASAVLPGLAIVATVKVVENSTDYSLQNTIQQALFLRTSRDSKYKAKAAIDTFLVRLGDLGSMALVAAGVHLGLSVFGFAMTNVVAALTWLWIVRRLARHHAAATPVPEVEGAASQVVHDRVQTATALPSP
ncbi:MAG TPA: translocase [Polyangia bacterium]|nr:translocase [Polyangia bacterium]